MDIVDLVGQIFGAKVQSKGDEDIDTQVAEYRRTFEPYLGQMIEGSNEDLAPGDTLEQSPGNCGEDSD